MATIWLTYAWDDNKAGDVDFVAQELESAGITVKLDRWNIQAGNRLWPQIEAFIQNPTECDAWLLYATSNSLGSEPCKEEFAYALDRALDKRGNTFPVIGLFPASTGKDLIPAGIRTRLYVSLTDPDWKERVKAATEGRAVSIARQPIMPYALQVHRPIPSKPPYVIEVRPRAGTWAPFIVGIPVAEKDAIDLHLIHGHSNSIPMGCMLTISNPFVSTDGKWLCQVASNEATPTQSYYIQCQVLPTEFIFGIYKEPKLFLVKKSELVIPV